MDSLVMSFEDKVVYVDTLRRHVDQYLSDRYSLTMNRDGREFGSQYSQDRFMDGQRTRAFFGSFKEPEDFDRHDFRNYLQTAVQSDLPKTRVLIRGEQTDAGYYFSVGLRRR